MNLLCKRQRCRIAATERAQESHTLFRHELGLLQLNIARSVTRLQGQSLKSNWQRCQIAATEHAMDELDEIERVPESVLNDQTRFRHLMEVSPLSRLAPEAEECIGCSAVKVSDETPVVLAD